MRLWNKLASGEGGLEFVVILFIFMFSLAAGGKYLGWW